MSLKEILLGAMVGTLEELAEAKIVEALQKLHDKDPESYQRAVNSWMAFSEAISPWIDKSKTKIDDAILDGIDEAVKVSIEANAPYVGTPGTN